MKVAMFGTQPFEREFFDRANGKHGHEFEYFKPNLAAQTASLATGFSAICAFVNDSLDSEALFELNRAGVKLIALRCAGFNNVDLGAADELGMTILRVPAYSPHAVAEHTVALILALNRRLHRAYTRVREQNFSLNGLLGFDLHGRTVGIIGTGKIGELVGRIMHGFGCRLLAYDIVENPVCVELGARYVTPLELARDSDIVTLHCPLTPQTHRMIDAEALGVMKPGAMLVNTSRGGLVDTRAVIDALNSGRLGSLGIDVYEEEADLFFRDLSDKIIQDDVFARLLTFPNVMITAHQGFFTQEALTGIAETTLQNITDFERGEIREVNCVSAKYLKR
jgi:D-lactate dehydrogenase